jgi:phosphate/sulfate permease
MTCFKPGVLLKIISAWIVGPILTMPMASRFYPALSQLMRNRKLITRSRRLTIASVGGRLFDFPATH